MFIKKLGQQWRFLLNWTKYHDNIRIKMNIKF